MKRTSYHCGGCEAPSPGWSDFPQALDPPNVMARLNGCQARTRCHPRQPDQLDALNFMPESSGAQHGGRSRHVRSRRCRRRAARQWRQLNQVFHHGWMPHPVEDNLLSIGTCAEDQADRRLFTHIRSCLSSQRDTTIWLLLLCGGWKGFQLEFDGRSGGNSQGR